MNHTFCFLSFLFAFLLIFIASLCRSFLFFLIFPTGSLLLTLAFLSLICSLGTPLPPFFFFCFSYLSIISLNSAYYITYVSFGSNAPASFGKTIVLKCFCGIAAFTINLNSREVSWHYSSLSNSRSFLLESLYL